VAAAEHGLEHGDDLAGTLGDEQRRRGRDLEVLKKPNAPGGTGIANFRLPIADWKILREKAGDLRAVVGLDHAPGDAGFAGARVRAGLAAGGVGQIVAAESLDQLRRGAAGEIVQAATGDAADLVEVQAETAGFEHDLAALGSRRSAGGVGEK
jgi:hypothetical protein